MCENSARHFGRSAIGASDRSRQRQQENADADHGEKCSREANRGQDQCAREILSSFGVIRGGKVESILLRVVRGGYGMSKRVGS